MGGGLLSGLTLRGRCLLAGGAAAVACSLVLDERDLLRIGLFVGLLPLVSLLLAAWTRRNVAAKRTIGPDRVPAGSGTQVAVTLRGGPLLGVLQVADTVPDAAGAQPAAPPRFTVHRLPSRSGIVLGYPLRPVLRGAHRIGPLRARTSDPLGLAEFSHELGEADQLLVLPRVVELRGMPAARGGEGARGAAVGHQGDGRPDVLVRAYHAGDELRRVHWRSTARHDELMVRLEERPWRGARTVLLDRRDAAHRGRGAESSLEFAISLAASVCAHLIRRGEPVTLATEDGRSTVDAAVATRLEPLLETLAAIRPSAREELAASAFAGPDDVVAILGIVDPGRLRQLVAGRPGGGHAVLLDAVSWDRASDAAAAPPSAEAATLRAAGWQVAVATAGTSPDRVWDELMRRSA